MQLPDSFVNEMNDFFTRHNEVPRDGFYESFDKVPLKGVRFSRSKITGSAQETEFLGDMNEEIKPVSWCSGGYYVNNEPGGRDPLYHAGVYYPQEPSAMLPAIAVSVSQSPPRDTAVRITSSKLSPSKKAVMASGTVSMQVSV